MSRPQTYQLPFHRSRPLYPRGCQSGTRGSPSVHCRAAAHPIVTRSAQPSAPQHDSQERNVSVSRTEAMHSPVSATVSDELAESFGALKGSHHADTAGLASSGFPTIHLIMTMAHPSPYPRPSCDDPPSSVVVGAAASACSLTPPLELRHAG